MAQQHFDTLLTVEGKCVSQAACSTQTIGYHKQQYALITK